MRVVVAFIALLCLGMGLTAADVTVANYFLVKLDPLLKRPDRHDKRGWKVSERMLRENRAWAGSWLLGGSGTPIEIIYERRARRFRVVRFDSRAFVDADRFAACWQAMGEYQP